MSGCGDFFAIKPTEIESKSIISDISRIRENPNVYNPLPEMYRTPPKRLVAAEGIKMFYFTKHHPAVEISADLKKMGFVVSQNPSTNQVVVHAASNEECDIIEDYLSRTDVPPIQVHVDCIILERFGDMTQDWETTLLIENLFGEKVTLGEDKFPGAAFPGASLRESQRSTFGLDFGIWKNKGVSGHQIRAAVDVLESRGYLKILLNPTLDTVNGKTATVQIRDRAPIEVTVTERTGNPYKLTKYEWVADTLTVTPSVYADGSIGLKTAITIGSKSKPEGVVQTPILTQRSIDVAENRIEPGKSLIIGGMRRSENRSVVRGVPFFKDLPLIGPLFSSKDFEENATEIVYILTPSISSGSVEYSKMADSLRKKYNGLSNDPNAMGAADSAAGETYTQFVEAKSAQASAETIRLQRDAKRAEFEAQEERLRAERAMLESKALLAQAEQAKAQYEQSVAQINAAQAQAEVAAKEAEVQKAFISQTTEEIQKAAAAAVAAGAAAQKANAEFEAARQKTQKAQEEAEKAKAQYDALQAEIEKINQTGRQESQAPPA